MNHTETPWVLCQQDGAKLAHTIFASSQLKAGRIEVAEWDSYVALAGGLNSGNAEANARRIVACVNACEGIETAELNEYCAVSAKEYQEIERQRDELLSALEKAAAVFRAYSELHDSKGATEKAISNMQHAMSCEEAITSVKGGVA